MGTVFGEGWGVVECSGRFMSMSPIFLGEIPCTRSFTKRGMSSEGGERGLVWGHVEALKRYEQAMTERTDKGYYRCKVQHEELYNEFMLCSN